MNRGFKTSLSIGLAVLGAFAAAAGCGLAKESTDSESHFLAFCQDDCSGGLSCVCGVCTTPCDTDAACQGVSNVATCQTPKVSACAENSGMLTCDAECSTDADCRTLGANYECLSGRCRTTTSGASSRITSDAGPLTSTLPEDTPLPVPGLDANCCPQVRFLWAGYELAGCTFTREGEPVPLCESQLPGCDDPDEITGRDIYQAMSAPGVQNLALQMRQGRESPIYGWDGLDPNAKSRTIGADFYSERGSEYIVASLWEYDCSEVVNGAMAPATCEPIPSGMRELAELQDTLLMQQLSRGSCAPEPGCYAPLAADACEPEARTANYDIEARQCFPALSCSSDGNAFESLLACDRACSNDPCALAPSVAPEDCAGLAVSLVTTDPATVRCFENNLQACLCACSASGAPLSACYRRTGAAPVVACDP